MMLKNKFKINKLIIVLVLMLSILNANEMVFATGEQNGDAVYRSGAFGYDHAGVYKNGNVYEHPGGSESVQLVSLSDFYDGYVYYGPYYRSISTAAVLDTCATLEADDTIGYIWSDIISPDSSWTYPSYISPSKIGFISCDGVVEYSYEWNNYWVWGRTDDGTFYGTPTHHDISHPDWWQEHNNLGKTSPWIELSPYVQRGAAGTQWTTLRHR